MGLSANVSKLVQNAIKKTGDLAARVTYVRVVPGAYNPTTDTAADTETSYTNIPVVLTNLDQTESDWFLPDKIMQKMVVAALDLPVSPLVTDYVLIDGVKWEVKRIRTVPGNSLWLVYIQSP